MVALTPRPGPGLGRWAARLGVALLFVVLACPQALADEARADELDVTRLAGGVDLQPDLYVLEDVTRELGFADVSRNGHDARFRRAEGEATFGFTQSAIWLRFVARNPGSQALPWLLEVPFPHLDHIDLYVVHESGLVEHRQAGDLRPYAARQVDVPTFVFPLQTDPQERVRIYLRAQSGGAVRVPLRAWLALDFLKHETQHDLVLWLFYGAVLIMACYNLGVAVLLRTREHVLFVGVLLSVGGAIFSLSGQTFQYLMPTVPWLANRAVAVFIALGLVFVQLYSLEVIKHYDAALKLMRVYRLTLPPTLAMVPLALLSSWGLRAVFVLVGLYLPFGIFKLHTIASLRLPSLRYYLLSFWVLAVTIPVAMLAHAKLLPSYPVAIWAAHFGCAGFAMLTALALPERINVMSHRLAGLNEQLSANVSELTLALARAEQATQEARSATKVKDEFMATMSHELRTPLNAIINVPQGLLEDFPSVRSATCSACNEDFLLEPGEQVDDHTSCDACHARGTLKPAQRTEYRGDPAHTARFLRKIERSGQHLLQMVNGVLDFSKMEAGRLELSLEPLDLKLLLQETVDAMSDLAAQRELSITLSLADSHEPCLGDALRIRQVLLNLLSNAIKFSERGGTIYLAWQRDDEADTLSVRDVGIGIAAEHHERVFASFEQVHKGDTRKYGGTGLGLSISRSLVRMHGGELWVDSQLGRGATFMFRIPRQPMRSVPVVTPSSAA